MRAAIEGVGVICPLGEGPAAVADGLRAGVHAWDRPIGPIRLRKRYPAHGALVRRLDRVGKLVAAAASTLDGPGPGPVSLALGTDLGCAETSYAFLGRLGAHGPRAVQPYDFPNLVPNAAAGHLGLLRGWTGPSLTFTGHEGGAHAALAWAVAEAAAGRAAVAGAVEDCGEVRARLAARGLDDPRPAEGAALLALGPPRAGAAGVLATASAFDPTTRSPFARDADPAAVAALLRGVLERAGLTDARAFPSTGPGVAEGIARAGLTRVVDVGPHAGRWGGDAALRAALAALTVDEGPGVVVTAARGGGLHAAVVGRLP